MYPFYETFLGCVDIPTTWPIVERAGIGIPSHLHPTIYMSEPGVHTKLSGQVGLGPDSMDMLSVAIKIKNDRPRSVKVCVNRHGTSILLQLHRRFFGND